MYSLTFKNHCSGLTGFRAKPFRCPMLHILHSPFAPSGQPVPDNPAQAEMVSGKSPVLFVSCSAGGAACCRLFLRLISCSAGRTARCRLSFWPVSCSAGGAACCSRSCFHFSVPSNKIFKCHNHFLLFWPSF